MANTSEMSDPSVENSINGQKITCHLVSLPRIVLTRIDETLDITKKASPLKKTPLKRLGTQNKTKQVNSKQMSGKNAASNKGKLTKNPVRSKKKQPPLGVKLAKIHKKTLLNKDTTTLKKTARTVGRGESETKTLLKKTMLQKRSKVSIPPVKKSKLSSPKAKKAVPLKPKTQVTPNKKVNTPTLKPTKEKFRNINIDLQQIDKTLDSDTSEDEFLYDELIEELENVPIKQPEHLQLPSEKTTNITLKPNVGNKPPTIVKGGIVKKTNLPADLKPIAPSNTVSPIKQSINSIEGSDPSKPILGRKKKSVPGKNKQQNSSGSPVPNKKPSPWPIAVPSPYKNNLKSTQKNQKNASKSKRNSVSTTQQPLKSQKTKSKVLSQSISPSINSISDVVSKPTSINVVRPKFGPKQTAKVTPLSQSLVQDDSLSDEYTEEETLENIDYEPLDDLSKPGNESTTHDTTVLKNNSTYNSTKDVDPNLDLLRILTDDPDDTPPSKPVESQEKDMQTSKISNSENLHTDSEKSSDPLDTSESTLEESPTVRTIYDLMNEVSLQYPSWNLHIIPETNAFCIAQVTKGRLGLPTLKKCIELDPNDYNAKVYIHQYHIKRFDGIYDSEESIIALIQEINSIKA
ncbi:hypothetical protein J6590_055287 [Homalodisca vitripennis]|nr:hypothetical protein J6590_055287 [Homalodisca vitripennis]